MMKKRLVSLLALGILLGLAVFASARPQEEEGEDLERFVPSEQVSADGAISFPVDI